MINTGRVCSLSRVKRSPNQGLLPTRFPRGKTPPFGAKMNQIIFIACLTIFLALPPLLFLCRYFRRKPAWWLIYTIVVLVGWVAVLGAVIFYYQYLGDCIASYQTPPQELVERWANDGAKKVFALFFGWLYSLLYSAPWLILYILAHFVRKFIGPSSAEQGA